MPSKKIEAVYKLKYDCKNSRRYECTDENFPLRDVYVLRPWSNEVEDFKLIIETKSK